jgi:hypothetical protein
MACAARDIWAEGGGDAAVREALTRAIAIAAQQGSETFRRRAAADRDLLTEAAKPSRAELLVELERIRVMTPPQYAWCDLPYGRRFGPRRSGYAVSSVVDASVALKWFLSEEAFPSIVDVRLIRDLLLVDGLRAEEGREKKSGRE